ncbi:MAG: ADP-L-glycero-D-manno-heptose-6-epimerase [Candidatus Niyogibacteria bacterium CG10_big_fil_rev_8_21_14_0_10_46_36]|uniref:ADP-L-glycero-D-manno-heptose-6-epimerase n=1 Tax=Candidatus Niyogibacteria bacterium CG10_big_fil_rev_8_21_14_0_10_46_36 TaxID=1974726 RepID=A0A2H0TEE1_9BACT|nr:MAG: ADP-L-glycero-D-manno-heptose-6-epimerase [Candidatus Niyogibacteria bacterium CG10_big_fil_rev_8_21_14_0_10_46_36]
MATHQKTVLVTGGAGFIGTNLIERLAADSHIRVVSLDNYFTGLKENHIEGATYIEGDTKDIFSHITEPVSIVYHLGEYPRVEQSFQDVRQVWEYNSMGTFAVIEFCRQQGCKLIYAGSSTKFADNGFGRHQSPYAWTKATNSDLVKNYGDWYGLPYSIAYFYNVYGPRERSGEYGSVIQIFKEQYIKGGPLTVRMPGNQRRNFTHVNDIVQGLILIGEKGEREEYGLGSEESHSILDIANMFESEIEMIPNRPGNRIDSSIDTTTARALGWKAEHSIRDYIASIVRSRTQVV